MSVSNPSHLLISRNPRSPAHPQLAPTLTTPHSPSTSIAPTFTLLHPWPLSGSAPSKRTMAEDDSPSDEGTISTAHSEEAITVHPTFDGSGLRGTVKVIVGHTVFCCHKEILWFASPFFQSLLAGHWAETTQGRPGGTDTDPPEGRGVFEETSSVYGGTVHLDADSADDADHGPDMEEILQELRDLPETTHRPAQESLASPESAPGAEVSTRDRNVQPTDDDRRGLPYRASNSSRKSSRVRRSLSSALRVSRVGEVLGDAEGRVDAVVELHEESAVAFQDFLFWCYPHLECKVTWSNVEDLLALSLKLLTPPLQKLCEHFLMTHASGRPVVALMLAEQHGNAELFREASRFVLDQATWDKDEMDALDETTQLKLSQRRGWFLERLIKLGTIDVKREYTCRPDCPDPSKCQTALDEKYRQAHLAVCRYGPPQPSVAYRCLRQLETFPTNPSLVMPHPLCQRAAQSWVTTLFDRMFQPKVGFCPLNPGTEKYWLWITLND